MLQVCGGSVYVTGLYSAALKNQFFTGADGQRQIENLIFASNLGCWCPASGFFNDSRWGGSRNTAIVASLVTATGYVGMWAWASELIVPAYWQLFMIWFVWGFGSGWYDNASLSVATRNFPQQRGRAIALNKAFYGISGSILTQVYFLFFHSDVPGLLLFFAVTFGLAGIMCAPTQYLVHASTHGEGDAAAARLSSGLKVVLALAFTLFGFTIARLLNSSMALNAASLAVTAAFLVLLSAVLHGRHPDEATECMLDHAADLAAVPVAEDVPPSVAVRRLEFWLLFLISFVGTGGGLTVINHCASMVVALGGSSTTSGVVVSLLSVLNCIGRMTYGVALDYLRGRVRCSFFVVVNLAVMTIGHLFLSVGFMPTLFVGAALVSFAYGGFWTLNPSMATEIFGTRYFATIYNMQALATSAACFVFSVTLASSLYEREAALQPHPDGQHNCTGPTCYRVTTLVLAAAAATGLVAATVLHLRRRGPCTVASEALARA